MTWGPAPKPPRFFKAYLRCSMWFSLFCVTLVELGEADRSAGEDQLAEGITKPTVRR